NRIGTFTWSPGLTLPPEPAGAITARSTPSSGVTFIVALTGATLSALAVYGMAAVVPAIPPGTIRTVIGIVAATVAPPATGQLARSAVTVQVPGNVALSVPARSPSSKTTRGCWALLPLTTAVI